MSIPERKHVLVVDDEPGIVELVANILKAAGYGAYCVDSAEAALELLPSIAPKICMIISDVTMGGMSGTELALQVRKQHPELPVLLISGYPEKSLDLHPLLPGVKFKQKPIRADEIRQIVENSSWVA